MKTPSKVRLLIVDHDYQDHDDDDDDNIEIDLSEADPAYVPDEIDWDTFDLDEPEEPIAPYVDSSTSWGEIDMAALLKGDLDEEPPVYLERGDGNMLLYSGKVSAIAGEPESGKGWFTMAAAIDVMHRCQAHVIYIDFEDSGAGVTGRLVKLGVPLSLIAEKFHYIRPDRPLGKNAKEQTFRDFAHTVLRCQKADGGLGLIVFDGMTEALAMHSIESKDNDAVAKWYGDMPRKFAHALGVAVLLLDHVTKASDDRGRYAIGAQAKLSALDGAQFTTEVRLPFARGRSGVVRISVTKDRPGYVRALATATKSQTQAVADLVITAKDDGTLRLALAEPDIQLDEDGSAKPTNVEGAIVKYMTKLKVNRGRQHILDGVKGRNEIKRKAFNELLDNGFITEYKQGRLTLYRIATPQEA